MDERITIQPASSYSITYWVLQHGNHPFEGELGSTGLRFTDTNGKQVMFDGAAIAEPAHYRVDVRLPSVGLWRINAVQGLFGEHEVGLLTVPGRIAVYPSPPSDPVADGHGAHWGAIRPPGFCADTQAPETSGDVALVRSTPVAGAPPPEQGTPRPILVAGSLAATVAATVAAVLLVRRRVTRRAGVPPSVLE